MQLFREFHDREPAELFEVKADWSSPGEFLGEAILIVYRSDKWGDGANDYIHFFDSSPGVYRMKADQELGNVPLEVALLGGLVELQILTEGGQVIDVGPGDVPGGPLDLPWLGAFEEEGQGRLIVLSSADPAECLLISSRRLEITSRGIVG